MYAVPGSLWTRREYHQLGRPSLARGMLRVSGTFTKKGRGSTKTGVRTLVAIGRDVDQSCGTMYMAMCILGHNNDAAKHVSEETVCCVKASDL